MPAPDYGILVHCHLRWDFVWQRPQHIISRLSQSHPVVFLEDPYPLPDGETEGRMQITRVSDTLIVARPLLIPHVGDPVKDAETDKVNAPLGKRLWTNSSPRKTGRASFTGFTRPCPHRCCEPGTTRSPSPTTAWTNSPTSSSRPSDIKQREADLMAHADVVFTGGPSMYAARKDKHPNVHLFNSGVDVEHFRKALAPETSVPADIAGLPHPFFLYYGVIDERMGWDNLEALADAHPEASIVMVGPLAKITEADLLKRPNIVYIGQRGYDDLPGYLKGCDVALVPFALSDATRYLSPTKTLEYFAARKPVVSTPIQDIVDHYTDAARIGSTSAEFVQACEAALAENNAERLDRGAAHADAQTWDNIVAAMRDLLDAAVAKNLAAVAENTGLTNSGADGSDMATGQVRWYSGSRGCGVVDTQGGDEVMAFLPGQAQDDLGGVREGDSVAVQPAGPSPHRGRRRKRREPVPARPGQVDGGQKRAAAEILASRKRTTVGGSADGRFSFGVHARERLLKRQRRDAERAVTLALSHTLSR
jgi:hypothetical protein